MIRIKRIYDPLAPDDGRRFLVDRIWPRGLKKEVVRLEGWLKDVAPSDALRTWFAHDPAKWDEFCDRYFAELDGKPETWQPVKEAASQGNVTLLYSARDTQHNNAMALKAYLVESLATGGRRDED